MKKYITFIITAALLLGASVVQADHHHKTNKVATAKAKKPAAKKSIPTMLARGTLLQLKKLEMQ